MPSSHVLADGKLPRPEGAPYPKYIKSEAKMPQERVQEFSGAGCGYLFVITDGLRASMWLQCALHVRGTRRYYQGP